MIIDMDVTRTTVPGTGTLVHFTTREGQSLAVLVEHDGPRRLMVYGEGDEPSRSVTLGRDEADRLAGVERRMAAVTRTMRAAPARRTAKTVGVARGAS